DADARRLIDERETEARHLAALLRQRVRPHRERRLAACQSLRRLTPYLGRQRARKPDDFGAKTGKPNRELAKMLFGEYLGRRHEGDLASAFDRLQRSKRGNDRLAGS